MAAAFFGISRKQVLIGWIMCSCSLILALPLGRETMSFDSFMIRMFLGLVGAFRLLPIASRHYREDDVLSSEPYVARRDFRMFMMITFFLIAIYLSQENCLSLAVRILSNIYFWPYFCLNQNHTCKMTAKSWLRSALRAIVPKPVFRPAPQPVPIKNLQV